jgi:hypothetical protein
LLVYLRQGWTRDRYVIDRCLGVGNDSPRGIDEVATGYLHLVPGTSPVRLVGHLPALDLGTAKPEEAVALLPPA